jgi:chorismate dehydratase
MTRVRLGAVGYLNARPLVVGLDCHPRFDLQFDIPSRCAMLLHEGATDLGLIPSIEFLRGPGGADGYRIVPGVAIASRGPVASVAVFAKRPIAEIRSLALDTSSRTSVALTRVMCARAWHIDPALEPLGPDVPAMLERCDAALVIGDVALLTGEIRLKPDTTTARNTYVEKIDLGEEWLKLTGLPFVYAFWAGRPGALTNDAVRALQEARDTGAAAPERVAAAYFGDPALQAIGARYLRDNIRYYLGDAERAGLETFYRYAVELGLAPSTDRLRFY